MTVGSKVCKTTQPILNAVYNMLCTDWSEKMPTIP